MTDNGSYCVSKSPLGMGARSPTTPAAASRSPAEMTTSPLIVSGVGSAPKHPEIVAVAVHPEHPIWQNPVEHGWQLGWPCWTAHTARALNAALGTTLLLAGGAPKQAMASASVHVSLKPS